ncbi:DUF1566 domain-containing protein [Janthinobacterium fluminis]|uniref:DUF1566 domain-containing protein n=1 Tax=Janthinobacterium fluminis TaxID=2987524 RepID=A0ABT5JU39_9BURK|nr:DUF1566 domain-containing protein [Janthinobacterium fluminis]MDC8756234.1 DUF1566 domain-containing protein [Janthinobacterium fluminis]
MAPTPATPDAVSATIPASGVPVAIGARLAGGFYAGRIAFDGAEYALIASPAAGALKGAWSNSTSRVDGAEHFADGMANTKAMAAAGSALAATALDLVIEGFADWYIPSRDELELLYRHFKPTDWENFADGLDGVNAHSVPAGVAYTDDVPGATATEGFQPGVGADSLGVHWYWSSTQYAAYPSDAWGQDFDDGYQNGYRKSDEGRARAVRRLKIQ